MGSTVLKAELVHDMPGITHLRRSAAVASTQPPGALVKRAKRRSGLKRSDPVGVLGWDAGHSEYFLRDPGVRLRVIPRSWDTEARSDELVVDRHPPRQEPVQDFGRKGVFSPGYAQRNTPLD